MTGTPAASALYTGTVMHHRPGPPEHRFVYPVTMYLLDLDELDRLDERLHLFGRNRRRPVSFHDADYLGSGRGPVRQKLRRLTDDAGLEWPGGPVRLLTQCRVFGYVFNPVSFYYLSDRDERLAAIVADVSNTFGERHAYVLRPDRAEPSGAPGPPDLVWHEKKVFHVSPFFSLDGTYRFTFSRPADRCIVGINLAVGGQTQIRTGLSLRRQPLTDGALARALVRLPLSTARVVAAIHWQAFRLWRKGAPFHTKPTYDPQAARGGRR
jgi:hypothetical protein